MEYPQKPLELDKNERQLLLSCSIERVINTSLDIAERCRKHPDSSTNEQDWIEMKELTVKLWNMARNSIWEKELSEANAKH